ncbi:MAG: phosphatidylserine/phosphatidylglycerophosphate/cardiolipin synthase family protein [Bacteroidales bacterium]|jgi:cardiolipin synthase|nr:phosphatidylserine/phosphatidylglycerophosphate/cardiolipin synthase family protein [Bacteroidales bacterium]
MDSLFRVFDDNGILFDNMLENISKAKSSVYLETYRFATDSLGKKFRDILIEKAKAGVKVMVLIDAWGSDFDNEFFEPLVQSGALLRVYKKILWQRRYFSKNHCRNHRKILIIDDRISYIGSSNLTEYSISWRELNLRIEEENLVKLFKTSFEESFRSYNKYSTKKKSYKRNKYYNSWVLLQDVPTPYNQTIKRYYQNMISLSKKEIIIESPYFLPGYKIRKRLCEAAQRGVKVTVIMPYHSDVHLVDIVRRKYLGELHQGGVTLMFYTLGNLHSKGFMVDNEVFSISSANFDYRSFRYQYELALIGKEPSIINSLKTHFEITLNNSRQFDYFSWQRRSRVEKLFEYLLLPFRYLM